MLRPANTRVSLHQVASRLASARRRLGGLRRGTGARRPSRWRSCGHLLRRHGSVRSSRAAVRVRNTSSRVAWRRLRSTASTPAASSAAHDLHEAHALERRGWSRPSASRRSSATPAVSASMARATAATRRRGDRHVDAVVADVRLQLVGGAVRNRAPVVEHDDVVGQLVGLVEVLGGEQDGGAVADEAAQHVPQLVPAPRVEAGRGLVEEQHLGGRRRGWRPGRGGGACRPRSS